MAFQNLKYKTNSGEFACTYFCYNKTWKQKLKLFKEKTEFQTDLIWHSRNKSLHQKNLSHECSQQILGIGEGCKNAVKRQTSWSRWGNERPSSSCTSSSSCLYNLRGTKGIGRQVLGSREGSGCLLDENMVWLMPLACLSPVWWTGPCLGSSRYQQALMCRFSSVDSGCTFAAWSFSLLLGEWFPWVTEVWGSQRAGLCHRVTREPEMSYSHSWRAQITLTLFSAS